MKRFVEYFYPSIGDYKDSVENRINDYAERNNLEIITIAPTHLRGMYVLFERKGGE